jgi:hypothetical protein
MAETTPLQEAMQQVDKSLEAAAGEAPRVPFRRDDSLKAWMRSTDQRLDQLTQLITRRLERIERFLGVSGD